MTWKRGRRSCKFAGVTGSVTPPSSPAIPSSDPGRSTEEFDRPLERARRPRRAQSAPGGRHPSDKVATAVRTILDRGAPTTCASNRVRGHARPAASRVSKPWGPCDLSRMMSSLCWGSSTSGRHSHVDWSLAVRCRTALATDVLPARHHASGVWCSVIRGNVSNNQRSLWNSVARHVGYAAKAGNDPDRHSGCREAQFPLIPLLLTTRPHFSISASR